MPCVKIEVRIKSGLKEAFLPTESLKANKNWQKRSLVLQYRFPQKTSYILKTSTLSTW